MAKTKQQSIDETIRPARPKDAAKITETFEEEYVDYYGMYVNPSELEQFLMEMKSGLEASDDPSEFRDDWNGNRDPEVVRTVESSESDFIGVGALKLQDNLVELGSTIIRPEYRSSQSTSGNSVYDELFMDRLDTAKNLINDSEDSAELAYTQLLADKSAATQHVADKHDFAVTGVYDKKFPMAYEGKGRVTVVDMLWADSEIENHQSNVYIPEEAESIVNSSLENINEKRSKGKERIEREIVSDHSENCEDKSYRVKPKVVEGPMNFAEVEIVESSNGDYSWDEVLTEVSEAQESIREGEDDSDYWVGLTLDANSEFLPSAASEFEDFGFEYCGFNPGKIDHGGENRDALEMQYRPSQESYVKEFVDEAVSFIESSGMSFEEADEGSGHDSSQKLEL